MPSFYSRLSRAASSSAAPAYSVQAQDEELDAAFADEADHDHPSHHLRDGTNGSDHKETDRLVFSLEDEDEAEAARARGVGSSSPAPGSAFSAHAGETTGGYDFERDPLADAVPPPKRRTLRERLLPSLYSRVATTDDHPHPAADPTQVPTPSPGQPQPETPAAGGGRRVGGGGQNDGVFANLSAKPDHVVRTGADGQLEYVGGDDDGSGNRGKDEILPSYDNAALDSAPPYWETTVTLPGGTYGVLGPDDVLVEGLPVGNLFGFAWNLLVSMSFQFIGFLLTYLLHTTHAAKNGSRAGLGITLIQYGLYLRARSMELASMTPEDLLRSMNSTASGGVQSLDETSDSWGLFGTPAQDWDGSSSSSGGAMAGSGPGRLVQGPNGTTIYEGPMGGVVTEEQLHMSSVANQWLSYVLMVIGWFLLLGGMLNYWRAVRWARAVRGEVAAGGTAV